MYQTNLRCKQIYISNIKCGLSIILSFSRQADVANAWSFCLSVDLD